MAQPNGEILNLAHACRVLDVPWDASPRAIKDSYRKLVKRWHPDRQPTDTESHADATLMTRLLNEAYARIQDAPLRKGFAAPFSGGQASGAGADAKTHADYSGAAREDYIPHDSPLDAAEYYRIIENTRREGAREDAARPFDWLGFAVRFVLGALFGALMSFRVMIDLSGSPVWFPWTSPLLFYFALWHPGSGAMRFGGRSGRAEYGGGAAGIRRFGLTGCYGAHASSFVAGSFICFGVDSFCVGLRRKPVYGCDDKHANRWEGGRGGTERRARRRACCHAERRAKRR